jgi:carbon storage regulator
MLCLTRRCGEEIVIGDNIHVTVLSVKRGQVRLGISAPRSVTVDRQEVHERRREFVEAEGADSAGRDGGLPASCHSNPLDAQKLHA